MSFEAEDLPGLPQGNEIRVADSRIGDIHSGILRGEVGWMRGSEREDQAIYFGEALATRFVLGDLALAGDA